MTENNVLSKLQEKFEYACENNSLNIVKHILETSSLKKHINLKECIGYLTSNALKKSNFILTDYLINQVEISIESKKSIINIAFFDACFQNNLNLLKDIYFNDKYNQYLDITNNSSGCFRTAYGNKRKIVLEFLILETNLDKNNNDVKMKMMENSEMRAYCESLFFKKELSIKLHMENSQSKVKLKI